MASQTGNFVPIGVCQCSLRLLLGGHGILRASNFADAVKRGQQCLVNGLVTGDDAAPLEHALRAVGGADVATRFAHQDQATGDIPRLEVTLDKTVEAAGRDPSEVEGGGAGAAQPTGAGHQGLTFAEKALVARAATVRNAGADQAVGQVLAVGDTQAPIVDEGALPALRRVKLIEDGIVDEAADDFAVALETDRNAEQRNAVQKIGRTIKGIDDPTMRFVGAGDNAALFHQEAIAGPGLAEFAKQHLLGAVVGGTDKI